MRLESFISPASSISATPPPPSPLSAVTDGEIKTKGKWWVTFNPLPLIGRIRTRFSAFYRLASRLNYKLKNLRLELFRTFLISSFQWRTLYWPQMSFSTSFILKKKVTLGLVVRIRNSVNFSKLYVGNSMVICVWKHLGNTLILSYGN